MPYISEYDEMQIDDSGKWLINAIPPESKTSDPVVFCNQYKLYTSTQKWKHKKLINHALISQWSHAKK